MTKANFGCKKADFYVHHQLKKYITYFFIADDIIILTISYLTSLEKIVKFHKLSSRKSNHSN